MKQMKVCKNLGNEVISDGQIKLIEKFTRRKMKAEELFVFSMILCDNEIDRDGERFDENSLEKLAEMYVGKTGVFDHLPSAENQSARIFKTEVVFDGTKNSLGQDYCGLKAFAYMVRCSKNEDLILEIDGGIKKEVSVGCAVAEVLCSVCGADQKTQSCEHQKGKSYNGVECHFLLSNPTDAYEWSFVAVPAQKNAGVVKRYSGERYKTIREKLHSDVAESFSQSEVDSLRKYVRSLETLAIAGEEYAESLKKEIVRNASVYQPEMDCKILEEVCDKLELEQLKVFHKSYEKIAEGKAMRSNSQLAKAFDEPQTDRQTQFKI